MKKITKKIQPKFLIRTKIAGDIVCEVALPERQTGKVAIVCGGAPSMPVRGEVLRFLSDQGYIAIGMRHRGTWESGGLFLEKSPAQDVTDIIDYLIKHRGIIDAWTEKKVSIKIKNLDLFGGSFGGPAVLLNSQNKNVRKVVALAPLVDWSRTGQDESFEDFVRFSQSGFGDAYRTKKVSDWQKLLRPDFYNPITIPENITPEKCFILQTLDDNVCPATNTQEFIEQNRGISFYFKPKGGHLGTSCILKKFYWNKIDTFLKRR